MITGTATATTKATRTQKGKPKKIWVRAVAWTIATMTRRWRDMQTSPYLDQRAVCTGSRPGQQTYRTMQATQFGSSNVQCNTLVKCHHG